MIAHTDKQTNQQMTRQHKIDPPHHPTRLARQSKAQHHGAAQSTPKRSSSSSSRPNTRNGDSFFPTSQPHTKSGVPRTD